MTKLCVPTTSQCFRYRKIRDDFCEDNDYIVGFLCPDYKGFLALMDKHFLEQLTVTYGGKDDKNSGKGNLNKGGTRINEDNSDL